MFEFLLGEANLLQTLGEQDAWIKPQLLSWKLDLNRQTLKRSADIIRRNLVHPEKPALSILVFFFAILISQFGNHHPGNKEVIEVSNATDKGLVGQVEASSTFPFWRPCVLLGLGIVVVSNVKFSNPAQVRHPINVGLIVTWILLTCLTLGLTFDLNLPFVEIILPYLAYACVTFSALTLVGDVYNWQKLAKKIETKETQMPYRPQLSSGFVSADEKDETMTQELLTNSSRESSSLKQTSILRPPSLNLASSRPCSPFIPIREKEDAESLLESQEIHLGATQRDISALSLDGSEDEREDGSPKPTAHAQREGTVSAFSIRDYDVSSGALQRSGIDFGNGKSPLIRPSRFGSAAHSQSNAPKSRVTKTSWVAGGYWQSGKNRGFASNSKSRANLATNGGMSRSSSHSSGFGSLSQGMNQGLFLSNSPPNSILGEERQSLFSEPLFHNLSRPPSQQGSILSRPPSVISQRRETHSQAGSETSCDSDFDRMTQEAFDSLKPKAKSSPIPKNEVKQSAGFLERQIDLKCSVYSILLGLSIAFNVAVLGGVVIYNL